MKKILIAGLFVTSLAACTKVDIVTPDDFTVTTNKATYLTTDTVKFNFTGNPGYITFFSGEVHKKYELSKVTEMDADSIILNFTTNTTAITATSQAVTVNNLKLFASTNFSGKYDSAGIKAATWTDISNRATWATTTTSVASGRVHLEDLRNGKLPIYIAFKYVSDTAKATALPRKWQLASFSYKNHYKDTAFALAGGIAGTSNPFMTGGFNQKSILNQASNWVYANANITFNAAVAGNLPDEDWSVSRGFEPNLYPSDLGIQIKNQSAVVGGYSYRFRTPGTYKVTFVAKNADSNTAAEVVRQITITVQ